MVRINFQTIGRREPRMARQRRPPRDLGRCPDSGKRRFNDESDALETGFAFQENNRYSVTSRSAYECEHCGDWHLTTR